jgi:hypothetical protein
MLGKTATVGSNRADVIYWPHTALIHSTHTLHRIDRYNALTRHRIHMYDSLSSNFSAHCGVPVFTCCTHAACSCVRCNYINRTHKRKIDNTLQVHGVIKSVHVCVVCIAVECHSVCRVKVTSIMLCAPTNVANQRYRGVHEMFWECGIR